MHWKPWYLIKFPNLKKNPKLQASLEWQLSCLTKLRCSLQFTATDLPLQTLHSEKFQHFLLTHQKTASKFLMLNQAGGAHGVKTPLLETASNLLLKPAARHCSASWKTVFWQPAKTPAQGWKTPALLHLTNMIWSVSEGDSNIALSLLSHFCFDLLNNFSSILTRYSNKGRC